MQRIDKLISFNRWMGLFHLVQGAAMVVLALTVDVFRDFRPQIYARFFETQGDLYFPGTQELFELPFSLLVASFLLLSAIFHFLIAVPLKERYKRNIVNGINPYRWYEYALSSSVMIVLLTTMFGLLTIEALIAIFVINALMNLFGLLMEKMNPPHRKKTDWHPFTFGWIAGITPWVLILIYLFGNTDISLLPWFVIPGVIFYFVVFNAFALNQYLQYKKIGRWADYIYGERAYVWLSLFGKSILAWVIFTGVLLA